MRPLTMLAALSCLALVGCSKNPTQPKSMALTAPTVEAVTAAKTAPTTGAAGRAGPGRPGYEPAYYNGQTFTISAVEVPNHAPQGAQADFYEVVYPIGWEGLGIPPPQCNPCDHTGDGIDFTDYHDHVLDSVPHSPGHGEFSPLWHVWLVMPAYSGNAQHDAQVTAAYAPHIPATSEAAVDELLGTKLADGSPAAVQVDTHFYFLCAVVSPNAVP